jgi:hypothetical protein
MRSIRELTPAERDAIEIYLLRHPDPPAVQARDEPFWRLIKFIHSLDKGNTQAVAMADAGLTSTGSAYRYVQLFKVWGIDALRLPNWVYNPRPSTHVIVEGDSVISVNKAGRINFYEFDGRNLLEQENL